MLSWYLTITLPFHSEQSLVRSSYNCISLLLMLCYIFGIKTTFRVKSICAIGNNSHEILNGVVLVVVYIQDKAHIVQWWPIS